MPDFVLTPESSVGARYERIVLNPIEVATFDRIEIDLHSDAIRVREGGIDWGDTAIEAFTAEQQFGSSPIDYRLPNRIITIPLILGATGDFDAARIALQAECSRICEEGGWLKREIVGGTYGEAGSHLFCDLVKATLKYGGGTFQASDGVDPEAELILEALPDFYGDEETGELHEGTGDLSWTEQIKGNLPGRVTSLTVTDKSGNDQLGLGWAFRCRNYDPAATAAWAYEAEALTPLDLAATFALSGASGSGKNTIRHNNLSTGWTPVLSTNLKAGTYLTHKGLYDVWARVYTTSATPPWLRLVYDVGDLVAPSENVQVQVPGANNFYLVPLGQINLRGGAVRWQGAIQAYGAAGGENVYIDRLEFFCADEGSGVLKAPLTAGIGLATYKCRDEFNQAKGALNGKALPDGSGNWVTESETGDADFEVNGTGAVTRVAKKDAAGRAAIAPAGELSTFAARLSWEWSAVSPAGGAAEQHMGLSFGGAFGFRANSKILSLFGTEINPWIWQPNVRYTLWLLVVGNVYAAGWVTQDGQQPSGPPTIFSPYTEGVAKGKVKFTDFYSGAAAVTRTYDDFAVWVPDRDAVIFANRNAVLSSQGMFRQSEDGLSGGPVAYPGADLPRIPVSGPEGRPVEIALKPSRGDFGQLPDSGLDKAAGQLSYRSCWSMIPEG